MTPDLPRSEIVAFFGNCCHALDPRAGLRADGRQVYEEGLFVPDQRLFAGASPTGAAAHRPGERRTPFEVVGDLYAQAGATRSAGRACWR
jgi:N-methylhydantoinase B/oxoprolinase/acetone carboxylase alpha subunit